MPKMTSAPSEMNLPFKSRSASSLFPGGYLAWVTAVLLTLFSVNPGFTQDPGEPVARVNGVTLYSSDLTCAIEASLARKLSSRYSDPGDLESEGEAVDSRETLNRLINIELLYQESLKHRFPGLAEESEKRYQQEVKRLGGEDRLASALLCNNITPSQFRKNIFRSISIQRLLDLAVYSRVQVTEEEIRKYYEENKDRFQRPESLRIRQILIKVPSQRDDDKWRQARDRAHAIYQEANDGSDFVLLARRHSEDPASASIGGDMGLIQTESLKDVFGTVVFSMQVGSVTKPIRSKQGFHIVKVVARNPRTARTLDESRQYITTLIRRERARGMISQLIDDLKARAEIEIMKKQ